MRRSWTSTASPAPTLIRVIIVYLFILNSSISSLTWTRRSWTSTTSPVSPGPPPPFQPRSGPLRASPTLRYPAASRTCRPAPHSNTHARTHTHAHTHTHTHTHTRTYTHTHARTHARTHTRTHTHTQTRRQPHLPPRRGSRTPSLPRSLASPPLPCSLAPSLAPRSLAPSLAPRSLAPSLAPRSLAPSQPNPPPTHTHAAGGGPGRRGSRAAGTCGGAAGTCGANTAPHTHHDTWTGQPHRPPRRGLRHTGPPHTHG